MRSVLYKQSDTCILDPSADAFGCRLPVIRVTTQPQIMAYVSQPQCTVRHGILGGMERAAESLRRSGGERLAHVMPHPEVRPGPEVPSQIAERLARRVLKIDRDIGARHSLGDVGQSGLDRPLPRQMQVYVWTHEPRPALR